MKYIDRKLSIAGMTAFLAVLFQVAAPRAAAQSAEAALIAKARAIHDRTLKIDTHHDISTANFTRDCNYAMRLTTQVNIPKMIEGDLDVSFMAVYTGQGSLTPEGYAAAYKEAIAKFEGIHRLTEEIAPDKIRLALTPAEVASLHKQGLLIVVIGIENGYPIGADIGRVKEFYDRGGRYISLTHNGGNQLADSNTGEVQGYLHNNGLSPLGRQVIAEMNRLGMMVDLSHPSRGANMEAIRLSKAPVIASHSAARALAGVSRNLDDEEMLAVKKSGGVVQIVGFSSYLRTDSKERVDALAKLQQEFGLAAGAGGGAAAAGRGAAAAAPAPPRACPVETPNAAPRPTAPAGGRASAALNALSPERRAQYEQRLAEINAKYPPAGRASVKDLVDHIDHAVKLTGLEHVGISSDFDGGGGVDGWNSAAETFNVTLELVRRGYTEQQIAQLWGGNLLRVWGEVEKVAQKLQKEGR